MKVIIEYKDNYQITLNGVNEIQNGNQFITFEFSNNQVYKGSFVIELSKIKDVRLEING